MKPTEFKTWEDVCAALGIDPTASIAFADGLPKDEYYPVIAFFKLTKLSQASYEGKKPDWSNTREYKYWPYFNMNDKNALAGFGFSYHVYDHWSTSKNVGSRLVFPTEAMAIHAGTQFIDWYRDLMVLPQI